MICTKSHLTSNFLSLCTVMLYLTWLLTPFWYSTLFQKSPNSFLFFARQKVLSKRSNAVKDTHYSCSLASKQVLDRQASLHTFCCRHLNKSGFFASAELRRLSALFFDFSGHVCRQLRFSKSSLTLYEVEASKSFFKGNFWL